ncbi:MAG TPA: class I SAM-dependent methyltransferase, partial [Methylomirabilota bacterium]|nr:class I SAM-dependent methyltransferase [Methylomirabilota bacterium]
MNAPAPYRAKVHYDEARSQKYNHRPEWRHRQEMALLEPALKAFPRGASVLDAPCGAGRVSVRLAELGLQPTAVDISEPMLELTREKLEPHGAADRVQKGDLERLPFPDRHFDGAVCFRFFNLLPEDVFRQRVIGELCRVSRQRVVISFNHPVSLHNLKRWFERRFKGRPRRNWTIHP